LVKERPLLLGRELEHFWKTEPELIRPIILKTYETEENLVVRAEVPGYTEKELNITCDPWRIVVTGKKEIKEEGKIEKKEEAPTYVEKGHTYKSVKFPAEVRPDAVRASLKNGIREVVLPKAELVKKVKIDVKPF
jgi:HSP20 family protein